MNETVEVGTHLPLTEVTYFILLSLSSGRRHGYAIMKDVEQLSQGRVVLSTGTLYGAIKRLLDLGWIERADDPKPSNGRRERKVYTLTDIGSARFERRSETHERFGGGSTITFRGRKHIKKRGL